MKNYVFALAGILLCLCSQDFAQAEYDTGERFVAKTRQECADQAATQMLQGIPAKYGEMTFLKRTLFLKSTVPHPTDPVFVYGFNIKVHPPEGKGSDHRVAGSVSVTFLDKDDEERTEEDSDDDVICKVAYFRGPRHEVGYDYTSYYTEKERSSTLRDEQACRNANTDQCTKTTFSTVFHVRDKQGQIVFQVYSALGQQMLLSPRSGLYVDQEQYDRESKLDFEDAEAQQAQEEEARERRLREKEGSQGQR